MTAFELDIEPKDEAGARSIDEFNRTVMIAISERIRAEGITKTKIAQRLNMDKSVLSRLLRGNQNITARTLGEILWALDFDFKIVLEDLLKEHGNAKNVFSQNARSQKPQSNVTYFKKHTTRSEKEKSTVVRNFTSSEAV